jgi:ubiquinone/menaquinone biosynthesis C-methylase UbiE
MTTQTIQDIRSVVREQYGQIAAGFKPEMQASCGCGAPSSGCCTSAGDVGNPTVSDVSLIYETPEAMQLPPEVAGLSLGCGDPISLARLQPGQTVLDLGSGGGIDCFLAAQKVGPTGRAIGVDMTPAMLEKARANQEKMGLQNVEFRLGEIEHLPVADNSVDVIISNCVINLSPDKAQVFREAFRVLRPGGSLAVSDIVTNGPLPESVLSSLSAWVGCMAGALDVNQYQEMLREAGFEEVAYTPVYFPQDVVDQALEQLGDAVDRSQFPAEALYTTVLSAKITARKPAM